MDNPAIEKVFQNDYIMAHILRMLDLKQQYELQKICKRLRLLMTKCVWTRDCKEMQMNRNQMGKLTDEEFFEVLQLNVENIQKLTIEAINDASLQMYFQLPCENLLELCIKWRRLDDNILTCIASNCPNLQLLDYDEEKDENYQPKMELLTLQTLWPLTNLQATIWRNLVKSISYADLCGLAVKVPLERLELYNVEMCADRWDLVSSSLVLSGMQVLKIDFRPEPHFQYWDFIKKCPNLQDLQIHLPQLPINDMFKEFKYLERIKINHCNSPQTIWSILCNTKLKFLEIQLCLYIKDNFKITEGHHRICESLQILKVIKENIGSYNDFWTIIFQSPSTNFENLRELIFINHNVCDDFLRSVALKCQQLEVLHLDQCRISGKYINHLTKVRKLTLVNNSIPMPWSNLYSILNGLKMLQHLELDCMSLTRDDLAIAPYTTNVANSLETLIISRTEEGTNFWEYILENCEDSFQKVHVLHFAIFEVGAYFDYSFFEEFPHLQTLQIEGKAFIAEDMIPTAKHLIYVDCIDMRWSNVVEILKCTKVETLEIFDMSIEFDDSMDSLERDMQILRYIRRVTIPYSVFEGSCRFWQRCLEECPHFQLCCMGHTSQSKILEALFEKTTTYKRVTGIYANKDLNAIKTYCTQSISTSKIPLYLLDAENKMLWNPRYADNDCVLIIEV